MQQEPRDKSRRAIIVVGKPAVAGMAKTRLARTIGADAAASLYACFLDDVAHVVARAAARSTPAAATHLAWRSDPGHASYQCFRERGFSLVEQPEGDLGQCLRGLAQRGLATGASQVLIVGTDSPTLSEDHLLDAFDCLEDGADVVVGPSFDGGYYLIGLSGDHPEVFNAIDWSTSAVLQQTLCRAKTAGLNCELLEFWYDVDTLDDLNRMRVHLLDYLAERDPERAPRTLSHLRVAAEPRDRS